MGCIIQKKGTNKSLCPYNVENSKKPALTQEKANSLIHKNSNHNNEPLLISKEHLAPSPQNKLINNKEGTTTSLSDIRKVYKFEKNIIGSGHFGTVRLATLLSGPQKQFAVKSIFKERLKKDTHLLMRELEILKTLDHPNIVKFYEVYQDEKFLHLVMEYCSGGELVQRVVDQKCLGENEAAIIMKKIFLATNYLHERGICHRDLKPENFIFSHQGSDAEIKIIDFGLSKQFDANRNDPEGLFNDLTTIVGTPLYVAPEVLKGKYDHRCDNWSLGVITYILLSGNPPFFGASPHEIFIQMIQGQYSFSSVEWKNVSKKAKDFTSRLLCVNVKKRMTTSEALNHPWLNSSIKGEYDAVAKQVIEPKIINLIKNFRGASMLKKEAMRIIVNNLSENEIKNLREAFRLIDKNNTGMISVDELKKILADVGYQHKDEDFKEILQTFNQQTGEGEINYSEFIAATLDKKIYMNKERIFAAFKYLDVDNTDWITVENLMESCARAGRKIKKEVLEEWMKGIAKTKNGISFEEFNLMIRNECHEELSDEGEVGSADERK